MRVNFHGLFKDVQRLVNADAKAAPHGKSANAFSGMLGSLAPGRPQGTEKTSKSLRTEPVEPSFDPKQIGPMATYDFGPNKILSPELERLQLDYPDPGPVNPAEAGVKSPTVLGVRRTSEKSATYNETRSEQVGQVRNLMLAAGKKHGVDPVLGMAVVSAESDFNPRAVSADGHFSKGLFQLLDSTGAHMMKYLGLDRKYDPYDPNLNVELGVGYLRRLHDLFSQKSELPKDRVTIPAATSSSLEKFAVAAFNAGEGRVAFAQGRAQAAGLNASEFENVKAYLPQITQEYVERVMAFKAGFEDEQDA